MIIRRSAFFLLFTISGFSGLIYESIWTHYLKLYLGHAAYAQTLVLAIFMGGLSLGSILCSKYSPSWRNLLRGYAAAEGAIGVLALIFHPVFKHVVDVSHTAVIPALHSSSAAHIFKWVVSAVMILPQSVLLGTTFPLMSGALLRRFPRLPGSSLGMLYFTNSIGAAAGVLISGFFLIRLAGLPGTMIIAGLINISLALIVYFFAGEENGAFSAGAAPDDRAAETAVSRRLLLFASFLTGAASFMYEMGWIRMLSLVLGSSTHAFELMLSAFIFGLACGGFWIQRRIDRFSDPVRVLVIVQIAMGALAIATLPLYARSFGLMQSIMVQLPKTENGYLLFNLFSNTLALGIMVPATFCAGMTLPLITFAMIRQGHGEPSIGAVYAANTVGAIVGVFFAIHLGMPLLGLKGLLTAGACLDMILGLVLLWFIRTETHSRFFSLAAAFCLCMVAASLFGVVLDPLKMASGVYREGALLKPEDSKLLYYKDGKTASVSVIENRTASIGLDYISIRTNGKTDASINMTSPHRALPDEITMVLAGVLPLAYHSGPRTVANIGFGSGLTTHTLLLDPGISEVDTIEIEPEMVEGAKKFGAQVESAYRDPRSRIHIDDAKTFFSTGMKKYDIIVSEPSNPWVSGVSGLFSEEFYGLIGRHLNDDGLFVQWVQLYEIDLDLVASIFKAMDRNFSDFVAYTASWGDLLIIAKNRGSFDKGPSPGIFENPGLASQLKQTGIAGLEDIETRRIGTRKMLMPFFRVFPLRANSDYFPVLDQNAARARFLGQTALELVKLSDEPLPVVEMLAGTRASRSSTDVVFSHGDPKIRTVHTAMALRDFYLKGAFPKGAPVEADARVSAVRLRGMFHDCRMATDPNRRIYLFNTAKTMIPYLSPAESRRIWTKLESGPCANRLSSVEKDYVALFKAIGERDGGKMAAAARVLLENEDDITPARLKFVVCAGMLGNLARGNRQESAVMWKTYQIRTSGQKESFMLYFLKTETFIPGDDLQL